MDVVKEELELNVELYPDLAFFLKKSNDTKEQFLLKYNIDSEKKIIAITMRPYRFPNSKNPVQAYGKFKLEMAKVIDSIAKMNMIPVIIEHTHAVTSHENDGDTIKDVLKLVSKKNRLYICN